MALNKFFGPISAEDFWHKWDIGLTSEAIRYSTHYKDGKLKCGLPKGIMDDIAEVERDGIYWE